MEYPFGLSYIRIHLSEEFVTKVDECRSAKNSATISSSQDQKVRLQGMLQVKDDPSNKKYVETMVHGSSQNSVELPSLIIIFAPSKN